MKLFALSAVFCLTLLALTAWFVATPVYAAGSSAECGPGGGSISCTGIQCSSVDATPTGGGSCTCLQSNGTYETKTCTYKGDPAPKGDDPT
jgi:hypothetical protein